MSTTLLAQVGARLPHRSGRPVGLLAGALLVALAAAPGAHAQTFFGLNRTNNTLFITNVAAASSGQAASGVTITGLAAGQTLVGLDARPATGDLIALAYDGSGQGQLYSLNKSTGVATALGAALPLALGTGTEGIGFDFNPTVDRVRVTANNGADLRLNPNNGALAGNDTNLNIAGGGTPLVGSIAYTNSFIAAASTVLFDIDESRSTLFVQNPPGAGTLVSPVTITLSGSPLLQAGDQTDIDIFTNPNTRAQNTLLTRTRGGLTNLYSLDLTAGAATLLATNVGFGASFDDIAFNIDRTAPTASGQLLFAITTNNHLISFNSGQPGFVLTDTPLTGITAGQTLVRTDFRPNTGELFGLGYDPTLSTGNARLYTINPSTGVATAVGSAAITLALGSNLNGISADFNPTVDRLRVTSITGANFRLNPNNGTIAGTDTNLNFEDGTPGSPTIGAIAYTNSFVGSTSTVLFDVDGVRNQLFIQGRTTNPNLGRLSAVSANPVFANATGTSFDLDIAFDPGAQANNAFAVSNTGTASGATAPDGFSTLYTVNLTTAAATATGVVGLGVPVRDVAAFLNGANASAALSGRLLYGIAAGNLVSFDSGNPGVLRSAVNITGLAAGQVLAGMDFRPLTGDLFALGYDATNQLGQLYTLNITTGALTAVGSLNAMPLGNVAANLGVDFNPTNDALRVVSATNQANVAINANTGNVTVNTPVTNASGTPAISGLAYSNNDNSPATGTVLFGYDQVRNRLMSTANGAAGVYTDLPNASGVNLSATGVDFDIFSTVTNGAATANEGFILGSPGATDNLYTVDLASGSLALVGRVGSGSNLTGLAAFLTPTFVGITWTGAVSTDWGTAGNWSTGAVPTATDNVTIPNVSNKPVVSNAQQANNVTLLTGTTLTTAPGGVLTVNGNFANNNATTLGSGSGTVAFAGAAAQTISGTTSFFNNLTAGTAGVTATAPVQVQQVLQLNGNLASNGNLTLLSNATGTALVVNSGGVVSGNATVQRLVDGSLNAGLGYRQYSAPVGNTTVADLATAGFAPVVNAAYNTSATPGTTSPFPTVYGYDQSRLSTTTNNLSAFDKGFFSPAALTDPLVVGQGYTVNIGASQLVDFVGTLNNGDKTLSLARNADATAPDAGWQLLGNPYPAPLDYSQVAAADRPGLDAAIFVAQSSGQFTGTYRAFVNGIGGNPVLPVGQAFFARVSAGQTTGTLTFHNSQRLTAADNTTFQRPAADSRPQVQLALQGSAGPADTFYAYAESGATPAFDSQYDAVKLPNTTGLNLAGLAGSQPLAIDGRPAFTATTVLPLTVGVPAAGTYALAATLANLPAGLTAYLADAQTGQTVNLSQTASYSFSVSAAQAATLLTGRFSLRFSATAPLAAAAPLSAATVSLYPNPAHERFTVTVPAVTGASEVRAELLNVMGQVVRRQSVALPAAGASLSVDAANLATGVYLLRLQAGTSALVQRVVLQ